LVDVVVPEIENIPTANSAPVQKSEGAEGSGRAIKAVKRPSTRDELVNSQIMKIKDEEREELKLSKGKEPNIEEEEPYEPDFEEEEPENDHAGNDFVGDGEFTLEEQEAKNDIKCLAGQEAILEEQEKAIKEVADILSVTPSNAGILLRHFRWNKDKLFSAYLQDPARVCKEVGISVSVAGPAGPSAAQRLRQSHYICSICGETTSLEESTSLACHHRFCNTCWESFITMKVIEGQTKISCPAVKCNMHVEESVVKKIVKTEIYEKYVRFVTKSFVEDNPSVRWCPAPGCGNAINVLDVIKGSIVCSCGFRFCFTCHDEAHAPATCEQNKLWMAKCRDDSETHHWIYANTQDCPKCKSAIEKNGGCNHMTCKVCSHEYCWVCKRDWKGHSDYYSCNKFKKEENKKKSKKKESQKEKEARDKENHRLALEKYLHYYQRYMNHDKSRQFEQQIRESSRIKMTEMQETDATWVGVQFIAKAAEQLILCRSALKYSYIYAYYLPDGPAKNLFEYLQKDLEETAEELSAALASPIETIQRVQIVNLTRLSERRLNGLLETKLEDG